MSRKNALAGALLASSSLIGPMTAAERSRGRYMRAPDHSAGTGDAEFDAFAADSEVQVGKPAIESNQDEPPKPAAKKGGSGKPPREAKPAAGKDAGAEKPAKDAADKAAGKGKPGEGDEPAGDGDGDEGDDNEDDEDDEEEPEPKPRKKASERIRELTRDRSRDRQTIRTLEQRLSALEKGGLPASETGGKSGDAEKAPDPTDTAKYPLGHLDDRYIEDRLEYLAEKKASERADAVLQRQQEGEQQERAEAARAELLDKVDDLSTRGSELYDDFQEAVVEAGLKGTWRLEQATFEAAHEADNGAQILYELSQDKAEAKRVAALSPYQQMKFVSERDAEIASKGKPRTKPRADAPPSTQTRGANSSARISPSTDNLNDFEKAWAADEKGSR